MKFLIVDDNRDNAEITEAVLEALGYHCFLAFTAKDAVDLAKAHQFEAIALDIGLPDSNGYLVACEIRRHYPPTAQPKLVAISGYAYDPTHPNATEAAFDAYLIKPAPLESILSAFGISVGRR